MFATLLGAYPIPADRQPSDEELVRETIAQQDVAGLDPVSDGRVRGRDGQPGSEAADRGFFRLPASPEEVVGDWEFAANCTERSVKQAIPGPYTLARRAADAATRTNRGHARPASAVALAETLRETILALAAAGCPFIEIDEPAAILIGDDPTERKAFREAHLRLTEGVAGTHLSLVLTGGNVDTAGAGTFFDLPYASYAFDLIAGPDNWRLIAQSPPDRGIVCGAMDPAAGSSDRPEVLVWAAHYAASTGQRGLVRVGLANASGLADLTPGRARRKAVALADAARIASVDSAEELARAMDPQAIDIRSAALGGYTPASERAEPDR